MGTSWRRQALLLTACSILDPSDVSLLPKGFYLITYLTCIKTLRGSNDLHLLGLDSSSELSPGWGDEKRKSWRTRAILFRARRRRMVLWCGWCAALLILFGPMTS